MSFWRRLRYRAKGLILGYVPGMITCAEFEGFVGDYFEDRLALKQRRVFEWRPSSPLTKSALDASGLV